MAEGVTTHAPTSSNCFADCEASVLNAYSTQNASAFCSLDYSCTYDCWSAADTYCPMMCECDLENLFATSVSVSASWYCDGDEACQGAVTGYFNMFIMSYSYDDITALLASTCSPSDDDANTYSFSYSDECGSSCDGDVSTAFVDGDATAFCALDRSCLDSDTCGAYYDVLCECDQDSTFDSSVNITSDWFCSSDAST